MGIHDNEFNEEDLEFDAAVNEWHEKFWAAGYRDDEALRVEFIDDGYDISLAGDGTGPYDSRADVLATLQLHWDGYLGYSEQHRAMCREEGICPELVDDAWWDWDDV